MGNTQKFTIVLVFCFSILMSAEGWAIRPSYEKKEDTSHTSLTTGSAPDVVSTGLQRFVDPGTALSTVAKLISSASMKQDSGKSLDDAFVVARRTMLYGIGGLGGPTLSAAALLAQTAVLSMPPTVRDDLELSLKKTDDELFQDYEKSRIAGTPLDAKERKQIETRIHKLAGFDELFRYSGGDKIDLWKKFLEIQKAVAGGRPEDAQKIAAELITATAGSKRKVLQQELNTVLKNDPTSTTEFPLSKDPVFKHIMAALEVERAFSADPNIVKDPESVSEFKFSMADSKTPKDFLSDAGFKIAAFNARKDDNKRAEDYQRNLKAAVDQAAKDRNGLSDAQKKMLKENPHWLARQYALNPVEKNEYLVNAFAAGLPKDGKGNLIQAAHENPWHNGELTPGVPSTVVHQVDPKADNGALLREYVKGVGGKDTEGGQYSTVPAEKENGAISTASEAGWNYSAIPLEKRDPKMIDAFRDTYTAKLDEKGNLAWEHHPIPNDEPFSAPTKKPDETIAAGDGPQAAPLSRPTTGSTGTGGTEKPSTKPVAGGDDDDDATAIKPEPASTLWGDLTDIAKKWGAAETAMKGEQDKAKETIIHIDNLAGVNRVASNEANKKTNADAEEAILASENRDAHETALKETKTAQTATGNFWNKRIAQPAKDLAKRVSGWFNPADSGSAAPAQTEAPTRAGLVEKASTDPLDGIEDNIVAKLWDWWTPKE